MLYPPIVTSNNPPHDAPLHASARASPQAELPSYFDRVHIDVDARTIPCHPYIDTCNANLICRLVEILVRETGTTTVLDAGAGSGQVSRLLLGLPRVEAFACDRAPQVKEHFERSVELVGVQYFACDLIRDLLPRTFDIIVCRGAYHHIPKRDRIRFITTLLHAARFVIIADEAVAEYADEPERLRHCESWYQHVIVESERRGLPELVELEREFLHEEQAANADSGGDFKESPREFLLDAAAAGAQVLTLDRLGPWSTHAGGFFVAVLAPEELP